MLDLVTKLVKSVYPKLWSLDIALLGLILFIDRCTKLYEEWKKKWSKHNNKKKTNQAQPKSYLREILLCWHYNFAVVDEVAEVFRNTNR